MVKEIKFNFNLEPKQKELPFEIVGEINSEEGRIKPSEDNINKMYDNYTIIERHGCLYGTIMAWNDNDNVHGVHLYRVKFKN